MKISEAKILITGAAGGIGRHIVEAFLSSSAKIIAVDKDEIALQSIEDHPNLVKLSCDLTNPTEVNALAEKIFNEYNGINVCVNNAGIIHSEPLFNLLGKTDKKHNAENWKNVMDINLNAVFYVTANMVQQMISKKTKGVIINISSISAQGNMGQSAYAATKAAVEALTKTWSKELGMFGIRSACIAPGFFDTPSTRKSLSEAMLQKWTKAVPLAKLGELEQFSSAIKFIIENEYFNGKVLALDGGLTI